MRERKMKKPNPLFIFLSHIFLSDRSRRPLIVTVYSHRSAVNGSTFIALRAGI